MFHLGYDFYWSGLTRQRIHGVGIAVKRISGIKINSIQNTSSRVMAVDSNVRGCKLRIASCYAPTAKTPLSTKEAFYCDLAAISKPEKTRKLLVRGNFNAELELCRKTLVL